MKTQKAIPPLPLYVIERVENRWELYNTLEIVTFEFNTRTEAEQALKLLTETKQN